jgi:dGTPase
MSFDPVPWGLRRSDAAQKRPFDQRPEDERDRSRIIHCAAFRRLQGKTQVIGITEGDFHRTRLTHSMEVAQIGRGIVLQLQADYEDNREVLDALPRSSPDVPVKVDACSLA